MRKNKTLRAKMESMRISVVPLLVKTSGERMNAHNFAASLGIEIKTRKSPTNGGFEIYRIR